MNEPHRDYLIEGYLDDTLTDAERAEFDALVRHSASMRLRFWDLAEVHGLAREAARMAWGPVENGAAAVGGDVPASGFREGKGAVAVGGWFTRLMPRALTPMAAGLAIGILCTSVAWAFVGQSAARIVTLLQDSFESGPAPSSTGVPVAPGRWAGDYSEVVGEEQQISPAGGEKMLRFLSADYEGKPEPGGFSADCFRLIDLRPFRREFSDGGAVVRLSAAFNALVSQVGETDACDVCMFALDAEMAMSGLMRLENKLFTGSLAMARSSRNTLDRDPSTWQRVACELRLPAHADFLMIRIGILHGSRRPGAFAGHYADDVRVTMARRAPLP